MVEDLWETKVGSRIVQDLLCACGEFRFELVRGMAIQVVLTLWKCVVGMVS